LIFIFDKSGGAAGTCVDLVLFPLDTLKTRLQSQKGFLKSGGFRGIYNGLSSAVVGSAPTAAVFFIVYEKTKVQLENKMSPFLSHMTAANLGEIVKLRLIALISQT
jgi:solute carrier family 25 S-adenosylmethionine transporter 26